MEQDYSYYFANMAESFKETEWLRSMYIAFNGLQGDLKVDGNQWCATSGDWPEHNITGFGDTPALAMNNWYSNYFTQKAKPESK